VQRTLRAREAELRRHPNVQGLAIGGRVRDGVRGEALAIRVYVARKLPKARLAASERLPRRVRGVLADGSPAPWSVPVDVVRGVGALAALSLEGGQGLRGLFGDLGTLGAVLRTRSRSGAPRRDYLLTNAHVAAGTGFGPAQLRRREAAGRPIAVRRAADGRAVADVERLTELDPQRVNRMDAALCWIHADEWIAPGWIRGESEPIVGAESVGFRSAHRYAYVNRAGVRKTYAAPDRRLTEVVDVDGVPVPFAGWLSLTGSGRRYRVEPGDSGSLLFREAPDGLLAAGLVFAGRGNTIGVFPIDRVLARLGRAEAGRSGRSEDLSGAFAAAPPR
jgi:hypothetical protein